MFQVCDDGSTEYPLLNELKNDPIPHNVRVYRVKKDYGFNSHGARNLLMKESSTYWNCFFDMDVLVTKELIDTILGENLVNDSFYMFNTTKYGTHPNCFVMNKDVFWSAGGYDEEFRGFHYGDRQFTNYLATIYNQIEKDWTINVLRGARKRVTSKDTKIARYDEDLRVFYQPYYYYDNKDVLCDEAFDKIKKFVELRYKCEELLECKSIINFEWERLA